MGTTLISTYAFDFRAIFNNKHEHTEIGFLAILRDYEGINS